MPRPIKFRVWNGHKMYYPNSITIQTGGWDNESQDPSFSFQPDDTGGGTQTVPFGMQFTGLRDNNDKEVYEGDILRLQPGVEVYRIVMFCNGEWLLPCVDGRHEPWRIGVIISSHQEAEVIGNAYENPELLDPRE